LKDTVDDPASFCPPPDCSALPRRRFVAVAPVDGGGQPLAFGRRLERLGYPGQRRRRQRPRADGRTLARRQFSVVHAPVAHFGVNPFPGETKMSIQLAPNATPSAQAGRPAAARPITVTVTAPRILQSARAPAQLSFFFKKA
jgi:hypothetical protein